MIEEFGKYPGPQKSFHNCAMPVGTMSVKGNMQMVTVLEKQNKKKQNKLMLLLVNFKFALKLGDYCNNSPMKEI